MWARVGASIRRAVQNMGDLTPPGDQFLLKLGGSEEMLSRWELANDRMFGGLSECTLSLGAEDSIRFSGSTSLELNPDLPIIKNEKGKRVTKTGWCAMQAEVLDEGWVLEDSDGLLLRVRHSGERNFFFNLRSEGVLGEERMDLYQAQIPPPPKPMEWCALPAHRRPCVFAQARRASTCARRSTVVIPFGAFQLTWKGYVQSVQPAINRNRIKHIGLLLSDKAAGPFSIELDELSAFRVDPTSQEPHHQAILKLNQMRGYEADASERDLQM